MKAFVDANFLVYLNTLRGERRKPLEEFWGNLIEEELILNVIVVDEALYISRRYGVPYSDTFEFLRRVVLPFVEIVPLDAEDLYAAEKYLVNYGFKPSDAFHIATMEKAGATLIVSEDKDFDKVAWIKRVWPKSLSPKES
jgi:predicted nucleic acid-binding protein